MFIITVLNSNLLNRFAAQFAFIENTAGGQFSSLASKSNQLFLVMGVRVSSTNSIVILVHNFSGTVYYDIVYRTNNNWTVNTNSSGTVELLYGGSSSNIIAGAIRIY